ILNTAAFPAPRIPRRISLCRVPGLGPLLVRGLNGFAGPATRMAMNRRSLAADEKRGYLYPYDSWDNRVAVHAFVRDIPMRPSHPSWATLAAIGEGLAALRGRPVMIVWGGRDFCFNRFFFDRWTKIFPLAEKCLLPEAGHYVLEDAEHDAITPIRNFLLEASS
ncbi:MAG: alpha/beta hydrolase, partial [Opitutus sp.]